MLLRNCVVKSHFFCILSNKTDAPHSTHAILALCGERQSRRLQRSAGRVCVWAGLHTHPVCERQKNHPPTPHNHMDALSPRSIDAPFLGDGDTPASPSSSAASPAVPSPPPHAPPPPPDEILSRPPPRWRSRWREAGQGRPGRRQWRGGGGGGGGGSGRGTRGGVAARLLATALASWDKALILAAVITVICLAAVKGASFFRDTLTWLAAHSGWAGWGVFVAAYSLNVALFLPGVAGALAAGFVFGMPRGLLGTWLGAAAGSCAAFLIARHLVGASLATALRGRSRLWAALDTALALEGWKLLLVLRLSPLVPYNLLNVAAAATRVPFWAFAAASAVGIIPECGLLVYAGTLAESITAIASGSAAHRGGVLVYVFGGLSVVAGIAGGVVATLLVRRAVKRAAAADAAADDDDGSDDGSPVRLLSLDREGCVCASPGYP